MCKLMASVLVSVRFRFGRSFVVLGYLIKVQLTSLYLTSLDIHSFMTSTSNGSSHSMIQAPLLASTLTVSVSHRCVFIHSYIQ